MSLGKISKEKEGKERIRFESGKTLLRHHLICRICFPWIFPCYPAQTPACSWVDPRFCHHTPKISSSSLNLQFPLWSFILPQIPSLRFVGVLNSQHSLFYPLPHPRLLPPGPFVNLYLFIGILPCLMELSHGDPVWTPIKFCQFGLEELLRACSFSPSQKFLQKSRKTQEHSGQHRDENVPSCLLPQWD